MASLGLPMPEACNAPEPVQERHKCQRRVAISESEDSDGGLVDDASIEDDSASPPGEPLVGAKCRRASPAPVHPYPAEVASSADHPASAAASLLGGPYHAGRKQVPVRGRGSEAGVSAESDSDHEIDGAEDVDNSDDDSEGPERDYDDGDDVYIFGFEKYGSTRAVELCSAPGRAHSVP